MKPEVVNDIANKLIDMGCYEVSFGDTISIGTPCKYSNLTSFF
jgi:hydroxymethylglutaryl-CoA lyase